MSDEPKLVLIVEDERPMAHALELKLQSEGFDTLVATNGVQCLELLEKEPVDVVLLDIMMPVMDGFQVLEQLQGQTRVPPIIVLSSLGQPEDQDKALRLGAKKYFVKYRTSLSRVIEEVKKY